MKLKRPLTWYEKLDAMELETCLPVTNKDSVYTAIKKFKEKYFSILTDPKTKKLFVWRLAKPKSKPN